MIKPFFPLFVLFILNSCSGQNPATPPKDTTPQGHTTIVKTQGSGPSDNIHCSIQDKAGNSWFGSTSEGVYRYDGKLFTQFTTKDGLNSNYVWAILEDKQGTIWFGTDAGLCRYDGKTISAISLTEAGLNNSYIDGAGDKNTGVKNEVFSIIQTKNGTIWFATTLGVYCYNGKSFTRFLDNTEIKNESGVTLNYVQCMLEDKNGTIWFGSGPMAFEGICRYDGKSITNFKPKNETWVRNIFEDKKGTIWFGTRHYGACCYDGKTFTFFTEKEGVGNPMLEDSAGNIWFGGEEKLGTVESAGGIWRYDGKSFTNFNTTNGLSKYFVWSITEDKTGAIWVGTRNNGLYKYDGKTFADFSDTNPIK